MKLDDDDAQVNTDDETGKADDDDVIANIDQEAIIVHGEALAMLLKYFPTF